MITKFIVSTALVVGFASAAMADSSGCQGSCSAQDMGKPAHYMTDARGAYASASTREIRWTRGEQAWLEFGSLPRAQ